MSQPGISTLKRLLPPALWRPLRAWGTAIVTPWRFAFRTGHFTSSLHEKARTPTGEALPWYTYPAIDFLAQRSFAGKNVLEFGGGQSTRWWAPRAATVLTIEEDQAWYESLRSTMAPNVSLHHVPADRRTRSIANVLPVVAASPIKKFDVVVIDGHLRKELVALAFDVLAPNGAIILDNADGYSFFDTLQGRGCRRIDFFGFAPGVSRRHCTSLVYVNDCFLLDPAIPIGQIEG